MLVWQLQEARQLHPAVAMADLHTHCGCTFPACLFCHSYGPQPTIASVSFGAARDFVLRHNGDRSRKISVHLSEGDVLIMAGTTQQHWQHCVPKRKAVCHPRINLTFRTILEPAEP